LIGLSRAELAAALVADGLVPERQARMRAQQLWHWPTCAAWAGILRHVQHFEGTCARRSTGAVSIARPAIGEEQGSSDGTRKWLAASRRAGPAGPSRSRRSTFPKRPRHVVHFEPGRLHADLLLLPHGTQKLGRNLTAEEISPSYSPPATGSATPRPRHAGRRHRPGRGSQGLQHRHDGHGRAALQFRERQEGAADRLRRDGLVSSKRRITLSTSGVVPEILRAGEEIGVMLAISLHATNDDLRDRLVPINRKYPLQELIAACRAYPGLSNARRITFEYVMLKDVNDSLADARALVQLLKGIPAKINLIPFNPWPGSNYQCSDWETIERFADFINEAGYASPIRTPRGRDILAACGQLKSESQRMKKTDRLALEAMMIAGHGA